MATIKKIGTDVSHATRRVFLDASPEQPLITAKAFYTLVQVSLIQMLLCFLVNLLGQDH